MLRRMTFGYELEVGDVDRRLEIPADLGSWEHAEADIVNLLPPYKFVAADPLGIDPPVGGEINIMPAPDPYALTARIERLIKWLQQPPREQIPTISSRAHGHVHVRVEGLRDDITALKQLTRYILDNQDDTVDMVYGFRELPWMKKAPGAYTYMKWDGARRMPGWMGENIIQMAENFDDFIRLQCCGRDGKSRGRPFRYAINTYCMKHIDTIEFRCFRGSLDRREIWSSIDFCQKFLEHALSDQEPVRSWAPFWNYKFPPMIYEEQHFTGWEKTHWPKERGKKERKFYDV